MCTISEVYVILLAVLGCRTAALAVPFVSVEELDELNDTEVIELPTNDLDGASASTEDAIDLSFYGNTMYGAPDAETTGQLVANYSAEHANVNPEELGSYLEGDILVPKQAHTPMTKNGVTSQSSRWPNGIVPFEIRGNFNAKDMATIEHAIDQYHKRTCLKFVPRTNERDYISIVSGNSGCWSSVGRVGGKQEVNLQTPGCLGKPGTAMHELMHALGFLHEQNRMERDGYVAIQYQNIQSSARSNFDRASNTDAFGVPYDYGSVMHYSANAFSVNGQPTIIAIKSNGRSEMGQRDGFSNYDVEKLNKMYGCANSPSPVRPNIPGPTPPVGVGPGAGANAGVGNPIIASFLGGLISGLGLADPLKSNETVH